MAKKRRKKKTGKMYFTEETENAIVAYNEATDREERNAIYEESLKYPLNKLAENIINKWPFDYLKDTETVASLKIQVLSFLVTTLGKYSQEKGKAFSYFSVIAKNWLILHNNNNWKNRKRMISLSANDEWGDPDSSSIEESFDLKVSMDEENEDLREFMQLLIVYWEDNISTTFKKERDQKIAYGVVQLMRDANTIEVFNKKALYMMLRDMTDCKTNYITKVVSKMKKVVSEQWTNYNETGLLGGEVDDFK